MTRSSFLKSLLVAPFAGFAAKKLANKVNPAWVDAPYEVEWGTSALMVQVDDRAYWWRHNGSELVLFPEPIGRVNQTTAAPGSTYHYKV